MKIKQISLLALALLLFLSLTACGSSAQGKILTVYQPLVSGMVHTWIEVELDDGTVVHAVLPDNDNIWNKARNSVGKRVQVKQSGDHWEFVDFK